VAAKVSANDQGTSNACPSLMSTDILIKPTLLICCCMFTVYIYLHCTLHASLYYIPVQINVYQNSSLCSHLTSYKVTSLIAANQWQISIWCNANL